MYPFSVKEELRVRIMGIDPGYGIVGYGVVEYDHGRFTPVKAGTIKTPSDMEFLKRLRVIYLDMQGLLEHYRPDEVAVEKLYFNTNKSVYSFDPETGKTKKIYTLNKGEGKQIFGLVTVGNYVRLAYKDDLTYAEKYISLKMK